MGGASRMAGDAGRMKSGSCRRPRSKESVPLTTFKVTRAHLKDACDRGDWDLLDRFLELDRSSLDDNSLYTDGWGEWWGLLLETIRRGEEPGLRVLLKHGARRDLASWGDCEPRTPAAAAADHPRLLELLHLPGVPAYVRSSDPPLPDCAGPEADAVNQQGEIRDRTGLVFQVEALKSSKPSR